MMKGSGNSRNLFFLLTLCVIQTLIPFLFNNSYYELHRDEFLYLEEGKHLAWGYMEAPPVLSLLAKICSLAGNTFFIIRLIPSLFGVFTFLLTADVVIKMGGGRMAVFISWLPFVLGIPRLFFLFQPNFLDVFSWTLIFYCIFDIIQNSKNLWLWIFLGTAISFAILSKYNCIFFILSLYLSILFSRYRNMFFNNKYFYLTHLIAFLITAPNILWQYNHNFPVITHMQTLQREQLVFNSAGSFIIDQFNLNFKSIIITITGIASIAFSKHFKKWRFLAICYFVLLLMYILLKGKGYYMLGIYPVIWSFGAVYLEKYFSPKLWPKLIVIVTTLVLGILLYPNSVPTFAPPELSTYYKNNPIYNNGFKWEDQKNHSIPQDYADMVGWEELARKTGRLYNSLKNEQKDSTIIYTYGYYYSGALSYYSKKYKLPETYSHEASFLLWLPEKFNSFKNVILIGHEMPDTSSVFIKHFKSVKLIDSLDNIYSREIGTKIIFCEGADSEANIKFNKRVVQIKNVIKRS